MSLRDRWRGVRGSGSSGDGGLRDGGNGSGSSVAAAGPGTTYDGPSGARMSGAAELTEFAPRQDGDYHCAERGLYLRFARPAVTETDTGIAEPARGEFTTSGRFSVQRRFARPIVYTVLGDAASNNDPAAYDALLVVRRTDTGTREAERLEFTFEADGR